MCDSRREVDVHAFYDTAHIYEDLRIICMDILDDLRDYDTGDGTLLTDGVVV